MRKGQRFFMVEVEGKKPSFYGGLKEIAEKYDLAYDRLTRLVNREGKKYHAENGVTITTVYFRVNN